MAIYHTQTEGRVFDTVNQSIEALGFEIIRVKTFNLGKARNIQIMIDRIDDDNVSIEDCAIVSRHINMLIKVADIIDEYTLEISSPGLNRPLTRKKDFIQNKNNIIKLVLFTSHNNKRKYIGKLVNIEDDKLTVAEKENGNLLSFELSNIEEAFLQYFDSNIKFNKKIKEVLN